MRIVLYSPYLDTFGGGEKYIMTMAEILSIENSVDILLDQHLYNLGVGKMKDILSERFNLNLDKIRFIKGPVGKNSNFFQRSIFLRKYDLLVYLTDGSIFYPSAKKNILHIQSPIVGQPSEDLWGRFKLSGWNLVIYNSNFTRESSQKNWPISSMVIYPPVDTDKIKPLRKKKYILSVGRFFGFLKDKKQELLIEVFRDLYQNEHLIDWSLHLVGSASDGDLVYLEQLQNLAQGLPVKFYPNLKYDDLIVLYGKSQIYWHAAGFDEEEPTKMEHFGISTVEAMAGGCVPVVVGKGGQLEIVEDQVSGYLWNSLEELKKLTINLTVNSNLRKKLSKEAIKKSMNFSKEKFTSKIIDLITQLH